MGQRTSARSREHSLPAVHALHLADVVARWSVTPRELFSELGLDEDALADPGARLSVGDIERLIDRARALTGEPALGFHLGMQMRISAHGYLGFAAMSSATVRQALELAIRFAPTRTTALGLRLQIERGTASLVIEDRADFGGARDVVLVALVVGIWQIGVALTGRELDGSAEFALPEPAYFARLAPYTPSVRFGQPSTQLVFDAGVLELPIQHADKAALRLAREQCEKALDALGGDAATVPKVARVLARRDGSIPSLERVAAELAVSPRTLKRRLAAEGARFSELVESQQRSSALLLLRSSELSIAQVADRLGYSDVANFTRAFRRWTGQTPAAYRREALRKGP